MKSELRKMEDCSAFVSLVRSRVPVVPSKSNGTHLVLTWIVKTRVEYSSLRQGMIDTPLCRRRLEITSRHGAVGLTSRYGASGLTSRHGAAGLTIRTAMPTGKFDMARAL